MSEQTIREKSQQIQNETGKYANTRGRVGAVLDDINDTKANKDASGLSEENKVAWKEALGVGELPDNLAEIDKEGEEGNTYTKEQVNTGLGKKLDKPTEEGTTATHPYVVGVDAEGNSVKLPAGDLGKNFSNTNLTFTEHRSHNLNGKNLSFSGGKVGFGVAAPTEAVDVSGRVKADAFILNTNNSSAIANRLRTNGTFLYHANSSAIEKRLMYADYSDLKGIAEQMSDDEKTEFKTILNGGFTTNTMSVALISPLIVKMEDKPSWILLKGANLNLNPTSFKLELIDKDSESVVAVIPNSQVQLFDNGTDLIFWYKMNELGEGDYKIRISNGIASYTTASNLKVVQDISYIDVSGLNWEKSINPKYTGNLYISNASGSQVSTRENVGGKGLNTGESLESIKSSPIPNLTLEDDFVIRYIFNTSSISFGSNSSTTFGVTTNSEDVNYTEIPMFLWTKIYEEGNYNKTISSFAGASSTPSIVYPKDMELKVTCIKQGNVLTEAIEIKGVQNNGKAIEGILIKSATINNSSSPLRFIANIQCKSKAGMNTLSYTNNTFTIEEIYKIR